MRWWLTFGMLAAAVGPREARAAAALTRDWCVNYYKADGGKSRAQDVAVDEAGKLYVAGARNGSIWVAKINPVPPTGTGCPADSSLIAWERTFPKGIAYGVAEASGSVYVLASLDPTGQCWVAKLDGVTGATEAGWPKTLAGCYAGHPADANQPRGSIRVAPGGDLVIGGWPYSGGQLMDFQVLKLDPAGNPVGPGFPLSYNGGGSDNFHELGVDGAGRIYVSGEAGLSQATLLRTTGLGGSWDGAFQKTWPWAGFSNGRRHSVQVDEFDNVIAGGQFFDAAGGGFYLYGFRSDGLPLYNFKYYTTYTGGTVFHDMTLGPMVCGGSLFISGNVGWIARFDAGDGSYRGGVLDGTSDRADGIAVDSQGFIYVAGMGSTGGVWLAKYQANCSLPPPPPCDPSVCGGPPPSGGTSNQQCTAYNFPNPARLKSGPTTLRWELPRPIDATVEVWDMTGALVRRWHFTEGGPGGFAGANAVAWDGTNESGQKVMQGMYVGLLKTRGGFCEKRWLIGVAP